MPDIFLPYLKAWAAFLGALVQVIIPFVTEGQAQTYLQIAFAILTVLSVYGVKNSEPALSKDDVTK